MSKKQVDRVEQPETKRFEVVAIFSEQDRRPEVSKLPGKLHAVRVGLRGCRPASVG
jgi:hypothetical protein